MRASDLGAVRVAWLSQRDPGGATRTAGHVRRSDSELYKVDVLLRGRGVIEQDGRFRYICFRLYSPGYGYTHAVRYRT